MSISENEKARYVVLGGITQFNIMMNELMKRNNSGPSASSRMLQTTPVIMNKNLGLMFQACKKNSTRAAWLVEVKDSMQWLVWFGHSHFDTTQNDEQGNLVPDRNKTESATFLLISNAFKAIEEYVLTGICVHNLHSSGTLETLTG
jgi:hypothetical protein